MARAAHRPVIFTPADDATIREQYPTTAAATLGKQLGKSAKQVRNRACYLGVIKEAHHRAGCYEYRALDAALNTLVRKG